ncbi:PREDICTED: protein NRT1/ PTR FAMILY 5.5-like [Erythranthe guttata]|nr:PREDICTED: protein NRT1/ PTR FAMILY 5.5-like [Erythranthe guttata]|eukprot:XP_012831766.1 PREDICTED: protein NRT1/ PTR FAMILY 5.5-like [Erythranthe guttata]
MTKSVVRLIPVWLTFILCGVVKAVGFTYFIEQLNHMNPKVGSLKVPLVLIIWYHEQAKLKFAQTCAVLITFLGLITGSKKLASSIGIAISMILAILCCITAAAVESRRLGVVQRHGLVDKHDERVPMTMFWLLPQFILLGAFEGFLTSGANLFVVDLSWMQRFLEQPDELTEELIDRSPASLQRFIDQPHIVMQRYLGLFNSGISGIGILGSILMVFVVGKISENGGKMNWFNMI